MHSGRTMRPSCTAVVVESSGGAQRSQVHYDPLGAELSGIVEAVEADERELDLAVGRREA